jgi:hypothetical protein
MHWFFGLVRKLPSARELARKAVVCAMVLSFLLANFGYPVWEPVIAKGNIPFPCQFSQCGCRTLEQCRQSCCCHSKQEKVAWALARGIDPDQIAVLTPEEKFQYAFAALSRVQVETTKTCCVPKPGCCSQQKQAAAQKTTELRWVLAVAAQKCHGTGIDWLQAGFVAAPPRPVLFTTHVPEAVLICAREPSWSASLREPLFRPA